MSLIKLALILQILLLSLAGCKDRTQAPGGLNLRLLPPAAQQAQVIGVGFPGDVHFIYLKLYDDGDVEIANASIDDQSGSALLNQIPAGKGYGLKVEGRYKTGSVLVEAWIDDITIKPGEVTQLGDVSLEWAAAPLITSFWEPEVLNFWGGTKTAENYATIYQEAKTITLITPYDTNLVNLEIKLDHDGVWMDLGGSRHEGTTVILDLLNYDLFTIHKTETIKTAYRVNVVHEMTSNAILEFSLKGADNAVLNADYIGVITQQRINVNGLSGVDKSALIASFKYQGVTLTVAGAYQTSGQTVNDFSNGGVTYTATALDGSTQSYLVTIAP